VALEASNALKRNSFTVRAKPSYVDAVRISLLEKFRENHSYVSVIFLKVTLKVR
jgi:hypothetical protein